MQDRLMRAALAEAAKGYPVFPLKPRQKVPAQHMTRWETKATTDTNQIELAWLNVPWNVGIATGPAGLVVVDLDVPKDGSLRSLEGDQMNHGSWRELVIRLGIGRCETYTAQSPSGGLHVYFKAPAGTELRNSSGRLGRWIDTRAQGGYVVAPGSRTGKGFYEVADDLPVGLLPEPLLDALTPKPYMERLPSPAFRLRDPEQTVSIILESVTRLRAGERHSGLLRASVRLGALLAQGHLTESRDVIETRLMDAVVDQVEPEDERTSWRTINDGLDWGMGHALVAVPNPGVGIA